MKIRLLITAVVAVCSAMLAPMASAQLRITEWNISNYSGGNAANLETSIYASFSGRSMSPDIFVCQEFLSQAAVNSFLAIVNAAPGSPGDWAAAPWQNGNDTDNAMFYRTSKVDFLGMTVIQVGSGPPLPPRDVNRYDVRLKGYAANEAVIAFYSSHMKAGSASDDQARRLIEAQNIRTDAENLPAGWNFILGGDFNIQQATQSAYVHMTANLANNAGRLFDPIATPGSWNNNFAFRFVHTQDPIGAGGMDDRHDQLLVSGSLVDNGALDYMGNPAIPYSTVTWDDANHSYRSWGNDGTSFNTTLATSTNTMVGQAIAQALQAMAAGGGHLPVFLDLQVPAKVSVPTIIDVGTVAVSATVNANLTVSNGGDVALWSNAGIADLTYSMVGTAGLTVPAGFFVTSPGVAGNLHLVGIDTSTAGPINQTVTVTSDDIDTPNAQVQIVGVVGIPCPGDGDGNSVVDLADLNLVLFNFGAIVAPGTNGDVDGNGSVDLADLNLVLFNFGTVC